MYQDIVADERIVYSYDMTMNGQRISVSVATIEFIAAPGGGTQFILTEQGAYLDGLDTQRRPRRGHARTARDCWPASCDDDVSER